MLAQFAGFYQLFPKNNFENILLNISMAVPTSFAIFGLTWISLLHINGVDNVLARDKFTLLALLIAGVILLMLKLSSYLLNGFNFKIFFMNVVAAIAIGFIATACQIVAPKYMLGDSFYLTNWSASGANLIDSGFPLFGLALANLSLLISPDFYLYSFHNIIAFSLVVAIISFCLSGRFFDNLKLSINQKANLFLSITSVMMIFIFNGMFQRHAIYVNFHLYAACLFLFPLLIFYNSNNTFSVIAAISIVIMLTAFSSVRMEGVLFALLLLWTFNIFTQNDKTITFSNLFSCAMILANLISLYTYSNDESFVSSSLLLILIGLVILFFPIVKISSHFLDRRKQVIMVFGSSVLIIITMFVIKPHHMAWNVLVMAVNMNPVFWGGLGLTLLLCLFLFWGKIFSDKNEDYDVAIFGVIFINALMLIFMLTFFRSPLRIGMNDSINRMMVHIIPVFLPFCIFYISQSKKLFSFAEKIFEKS